MIRSALLLAAALIAASCASAPRLHGRDEVIRRIVSSAVKLHAERETGTRRAASGVVLASDAVTARSWIITTRHLLDPPGAQRVWVTASGRKERVRAEVVASAGDVDLAVVEVSGLVLPAVALKAASRLGDEVWIVGFPWGKRLTLVSGVVSQLGSDDGDTAVEGAPRMVDASVSYGSSGGGVFDMVTGELIGIVEGYHTARLEIRDTPSRALDVPVPGETTVISARRIRDFVAGTALRFTAPGEADLPGGRPASSETTSP